MKTSSGLFFLIGRAVDCHPLTRGCRKAQTVAHSPGPVLLDVDREVGIVVCVGRTEEAKAGQRPLPALLSSRPTQTSMQIAPYDFLHRCKERRRLWPLSLAFGCAISVLNCVPAE